MRRIKLTNSNKVALIDDKDYELVSKLKWRLHGRGVNLYARTSLDGKKPMMHRLILNPPSGMDVDHINHNGLNNRRYNIRICTRTQNQANSKPRKGTSKYKGVLWSNTEKKWRAFIRINSKGRTIGRFDSELEATKAYKKAAIECFGEFAYKSGCDIPEEGGIE